MRLIDADALPKYNGYALSADAVAVAVENAPTIDAVPVVHGKWIPVTNGRGGSECNMCHAYAPSYQSGTEYNSPYCPNCGARMDGGADNG